MGFDNFNALCVCLLLCACLLFFHASAASATSASAASPIVLLSLFSFRASAGAAMLLMQCSRSKHLTLSSTDAQAGTKARVAGSPRCGKVYPNPLSDSLRQTKGGFPQGLDGSGWVVKYR